MVPGTAGRCGGQIFFAARAPSVNASATARLIRAHRGTITDFWNERFTNCGPNRSPTTKLQVNSPRLAVDRAAHRLTLATTRYTAGSSSWPPNTTNSLPAQRNTAWCSTRQRTNTLNPDRRSPSPTWRAGGRDCNPGSWHELLSGIPCRHHHRHLSPADSHGDEFFRLL